MAEQRHVLVGERGTCARRRGVRAFAAALAAAAGSLIALAAPALAEVRSGAAASTPEGAIPGGYDIVNLSASYDTAGTMAATITLREPPPSNPDATVVAKFGPVTAPDDPFCNSPGAEIGSFLDGSGTRWLFSPDTGDGGSASIEVAGNTIKLTATAAALAERPYLCASAGTFDLSGGSAVVLDSTDRVVALAAPPPPPPTPQLVLDVSGKTEVKRGKTAKLKASVSNPGTGPAEAAKFKVAAPKGLIVKPQKRKLNTIGPGASATVKIKAKTGAQTKRRSKVKLKATAAGGLSAKRTATITLAKPPRGGGGNEEGEGPAAPGAYAGELAGRALSLTVSADGRYMTGWSGSLQLTCGGFPGLPTYPVTALDFPKTRIPADGRLQATDDGELYNMALEARFVGDEVRDGVVRYSGPNRCHGSGEWTARLER